MMINVSNLVKDKLLNLYFVTLLSLFNLVLCSDVNNALSSFSSMDAVMQRSKEEFIQCPLNQDMDAKLVFNYTKLLCRKKEPALKDKCAHALCICSKVSGCVRDIFSIGCSLFSGMERFFTGRFFLPQGDILDKLMNIKTAYDNIFFIKNYMMNTKSNTLNNVVRLCSCTSGIITGFLSFTGVCCELFLNDSSSSDNSSSLIRYISVAQQYLLRAEGVFTIIYNIGMLPSIFTNLGNVLSDIF